MKLRYLTVLSSAMILASATDAAEIYNKDGNKLDIYGKINGVHYLSKNQDKNGDHSSIIYGFSGETKINDQVSGFGIWEYQASLDSPENSSVQDSRSLLGHVGIKFCELGSISYGRSYGVLYNVGRYTDVMSIFGDNVSIVDNFLSNRASNVITYQNNNLFGLISGLDLVLQYQGKNEDNRKYDKYLKCANGNGYGVSVAYNFDNGISTSAAYANGKLTENQKLLNDNDDNYNINQAKAYSVGLKYDANNLYIAALYNENHNMTPYGTFEGDRGDDNIYGFANKVKNVELVIQYQFDFGLHPSIGYLQSHVYRIEDNKQNNFLRKYIELGTSYNFNKNMSTFIDYQINLLKKENDFTNNAHVSTDDIFAFGITYTF